MPGMDGLSLLQVLRHEWPSVPVILMSVSTDSAVQAIQHGAADFILKPVPSNTLQLLWQHVYRRHVQASDNAAGDGGKAKAKNVRVTWTPQLHALFVAAVQKLGIDQAVPKEIKKVMGVSALKRQQIASHLQKYRMEQRIQGGGATAGAAAGGAGGGGMAAVGGGAAGEGPSAAVSGAEAAGLWTLPLGSFGNVNVAQAAAMQTGSYQGAQPSAHPNHLPGLHRGTGGTTAKDIAAITVGSQQAHAGGGGGGGGGGRGSWLGGAGTSARGALTAGAPLPPLAPLAAASARADAMAAAATPEPAVKTDKDTKEDTQD